MTLKMFYLRTKDTKNVIFVFTNTSLSMKSPTKMIAVFAFFLRTFCSILHVSFSA